MTKPSELKLEFIRKLDLKKTRIAVIGLGYVGLPLALDFSKAGFPVVGIDVDPAKLKLLRRGQSYLADVPASRLAEIPAGRMSFSEDYSMVGKCDAVLVCVPTPLNKTRDPDVHFLIECAQGVAKHLKRGMLLCLESTTYPGTTRELLAPLLEESGLKAGRDFFLAFSPERIDPGRPDFPLSKIPKVVGGLTEACLEAAQKLYEQIIDSVVPVSSAEAAEMVKLLENTFRAVNIALVNEVAIMCDKLGLDVWEVVDAAATKPYGFMRFIPGPGVGGHCIPLDPHYLSWKLRTLNYNARFIQLASEVNTQMPHYWVEKVQDALNQAGLPMRKSRVLVLGVAYKKDVEDFRESPALDIIDLLRQKGAEVQFHDPYVERISHNGFDIVGETDLKQALSEADCVLVATDHSCFDWDEIKRRAGILVDTRFVYKRRERLAPASF